MNERSKEICFRRARKKHDFSNIDQTISTSSCPRLMIRAEYLDLCELTSISTRRRIRTTATSIHESKKKITRDESSTFFVCGRRKTTVRYACSSSQTSMCRNSLMIESDIIQSLLDDLLDQICSITSQRTLPSSSMYYSSQMLENRFNQSFDLLNNSLKQLFTYEMKTVVENGHLNAASNIRHSRYYNPATTIRQMNDLKKKLHWIEQRQFIVKQLKLNQQEKIQETK